MTNTINAKDKFREGFIMLLRPFKFAELENPLQKLTILWAYSEQPILKNVLTENAKKESDAIVNDSRPMFFTKEQKTEYIDNKLQALFDDPKSYEQLYEGDIVQCFVDGKLCRFYPDEYRILNKEHLFEIMQEEGYHTIIPDEVKKLKDFKDKLHYLKSRGISDHIADKWASLSFQSLVIYKPYYQLLDMFCRTNEIYIDAFYEEIEGISLEKQKELIGENE